MRIEIVEIMRRSDQGMTRPFICRGDDGEVYFVKGKDAGRRNAKKSDFSEGHVFAAQTHQISGDFFRRDEYHQRLSNALDAWPTILSEIPDPWWFADDEQTVPVDFDPHTALETLKDFESDDFWTWT